MVGRDGGAPVRSDHLKKKKGIYICMYVYIYIHVHTHAHAPIYTHICLSIYLSLYISIYRERVGRDGGAPVRIDHLKKKKRYIHMYVCIYTYTYIHTHTPPYTHTHISIYLSVCLSTYLSIHRERGSDETAARPFALIT